MATYYFRGSDPTAKTRRIDSRTRQRDTEDSMRIAVIGGGAAGLSAAWSLSGQYETVLFEAAGYLGGHANTIDVAIGDRRIPVDTGFIVFNEPNYPNLVRLFQALGVETEPSDMSFSVSLAAGRLEYFGSPLGVFAQPSNLLRPEHWRMVRDIQRFNRDAPRWLSAPDASDISLGDALARGGYSKPFQRAYLMPMAAAIWSSKFEDILRFPARSFIQFFVNHGLLSLKGRPQWRTVRGGSREYVARLVATSNFESRTNAPVEAIERSPAGILVRTSKAEAERFDQVVFATPADRTLAILGTSASERERAMLGCFRYQPNRTVVHTDTRLMPRRRRVWASWNYLAHDDPTLSSRASVSYWMNRLQTLALPEPVIVSLNPLREPAPDRVFAEFQYQHPQFDRQAIEAQGGLPEIQGVNRAWFCGSYCGYGFHEDAVQAGFAVAGALGAPAPWAHQVTPRSPAATVVSEPMMAAAE
jgi:predicted NAD/FAD-binding protein